MRKQPQNTCNRFEFEWGLVTWFPDTDLKLNNLCNIYTKSKKLRLLSENRSFLPLFYNQRSETGSLQPENE